MATDSDTGPFTFNWDVPHRQLSVANSLSVYSPAFHCHNGIFQLKIDRKMASTALHLRTIPTEDEIGRGDWTRGQFKFKLSVTPGNRAISKLCSKVQIATFSSSVRYFLIRDFAPSSAFHSAVHRITITIDSMSSSSTAKRITAPEKPAGLLNQGATCYLNSLLQALCHTPAFRRLLLELPPESILKTESTPAPSPGNGNSTDLPHPTVSPDPDGARLISALQELFYTMTEEPGPASTARLTAAFGWGDSEVFVQHDAAELLHLLLDRLEVAMCGRPDLISAIQSMFTIQVRQEIRCTSVDYTSHRDDRILALNLPVAGFKTLESSLRSYLKEEKLSGDNRYKTDEHGLQDAAKRELLEVLPPVLVISLARFTYDPQTARPTKIQTRWDFPARLSVPGVDGPAQYALQAVLMHSGYINHGHYFAFVNCEGKWMLFNDELVTATDLSTVLKAGSGGGDRGVMDKVADSVPVLGWLRSNKEGARTPKPKPNPCAYLLTYVRSDSKVDSTVDPTRLGEIRARVEEARLTKLAATRTRRLNRASRRITVLTDRDCELWTTDDRLWENSAGSVVTVPNEHTLHMIVPQIYNMLGASSSTSVRLYTVTKTDSPRPGRPILAELHTPMVWAGWASDSSSVYARVADGSGSLVFIKAYEPPSGLRFIQSASVVKTIPFSTSEPIVAAARAVLNGTELQHTDANHGANPTPTPTPLGELVDKVDLMLYTDMFEPLGWTDTLASLQIVDSASYIIHVVKRSDAAAYRSHMTHLMTTIRVKLHASGGSGTPMYVNVPRDATVQALTDSVCDQLDLPANHVELSWRGRALSLRRDGATPFRALGSGHPDMSFTVADHDLHLDSLRVWLSESGPITPHPSLVYVDQPATVGTIAKACSALMPREEGRKVFMVAQTGLREIRMLNDWNMTESAVKMEFGDKVYWRADLSRNPPIYMIYTTSSGKHTHPPMAIDADSTTTVGDAARLAAEWGGEGSIVTDDGVVPGPDELLLPLVREGQCTLRYRVRHASVRTPMKALSL